MSKYVIKYTKTLDDSLEGWLDHTGDLVFY